MNRQFPPEIIQLIVEASLDPYDVFGDSVVAYKPRYSILKSYSLLNSTWYGASQSVLVRSVEFLAEGTVEDFLEMAERRGGTVEGVRDLCLSGACDGDSTTLLLKSTPHLRNLYFYGGTLDVGDLTPLQRLRRLELRSVNVVGSPSSSLLCLPHLQRLSLTNLLLTHSGSHFLTPAFLPQLRRIDTGDLDSIAPLIQQLEIVTSEYGFHDYSLLSRAESLLLLPLSENSAVRLAMFTNLPTLPPFLHINFSLAFRLGHGLILALEELLEAKDPGLRIILLNDHGLDNSTKSVIQRLQNRGIGVQLLDKRLDFDDATAVMDGIRAKEKRATEDGVGQGV